MRIFVAGATGVIGCQLLPLLVRDGHVVTAMTRTSDHVQQIRAAGAQPVVCDVFDRDRLHQVVVDAAPEVIIHQLTSIPRRIDPRRIQQDFALTNRLRTEGTQILMRAAQAAGARSFIAQSIAMYYQPNAAHPAEEDVPLYRDAPSAFAEVVQALDRLETIVLNTPGIRGFVLRYGHLYGAGTFYAANGSFTEDVKKRQVPIIGGGRGTFSFIHVEDAAAATALAVNSDKPGIYNIVDNEPAPIARWLPVYAELCAAPPPMRVNKLIGRLAAGRFGIFYMTEQRGASNRKAKEVLGWQPKHGSWREGFRAELAPMSELADVTG